MVDGEASSRASSRPSASCSIARRIESRLSGRCIAGCFRPTNRDHPERDRPRSGPIGWPACPKASDGPRGVLSRPPVPGGGSILDAGEAGAATPVNREPRGVGKLIGVAKNLLSRHRSARLTRLNWGSHRLTRYPLEPAGAAREGRSWMKGAVASGARRLGCRPRTQRDTAGSRWGRSATGPRHATSPSRAAAESSAITAMRSTGGCSRGHARVAPPSPTPSRSGASGPRAREPDRLAGFGAVSPAIPKVSRGLDQRRVSGAMVTLRRHRGTRGCREGQDRAKRTGIHDERKGHHRRQDRRWPATRTARGA